MLVRIQFFLEYFGKSLATLVRLIVLSTWKNKIKRQSNKTLIILGNGPSLRTSIEALGDDLKGADLMSVNLFPSTPEYSRLRPRYYITSAPEHYRSDMEGMYKDMQVSIFNGLSLKTEWPVEVFIAWTASKHAYWQNTISGNKNISVSYFNVTPVEGFKGFREALFRKQMGMPRPHNVLIPAIMMGMAKGYKNIVLLGADHSWLPLISVDEHNNALLDQKHFYDEHSSKVMPMAKIGKGQRKLHEMLEKFQVTFASYFVVKEYAESRKVKVFNATPGSFIDAFDRIDNKEVIRLIQLDKPQG